MFAPNEGCGYKPSVFFSRMTNAFHKLQFIWKIMIKISMCLYNV